MSEPQSTATKRFAGRPLWRCSAAAISSLPVPLSPSISTVLREAATRATVRYTSTIAGLRPTTIAASSAIAPSPFRGPSLWPRSESARRTVVLISSRFIGLLT